MARRKKGILTEIGTLNRKARGFSSLIDALIPMLPRALGQRLRKLSRNVRRTDRRVRRAGKAIDKIQE